MAFKGMLVSRVGIVPERRGRRPKPECLKSTPDQRPELERGELSRVGIEPTTRRLRVPLSLSTSVHSRPFVRESVGRASTAIH